MLACLVPCIALSNLAAAGPLFRAPFRSFVSGVASTAVAVGDVNMDGWPDLAVTNAGSNTISVLIGSGDGTFQEAMPFASGTYPRWVVAADMNKDAKVDLVVVNEVSRSISVFLGRGDGTLEPRLDFGARGPRYLVRVHS